MDAWVWVLIAIGILVATWLVWMVVQRKRTGSLKERFGPEYDTWLKHLGKARQELFRKQMNSEDRRELLHRMASPEAFENFLRKRPESNLEVKGSRNER